MARPRKQRLRKKTERKLSKNKLDKKSVLKNYGLLVLGIVFLMFIVFVLAEPSQPGSGSEGMRPLNNTLFVINSNIELNWTNSTNTIVGKNNTYVLELSNVSDFSYINYNGKDTFVNWTGTPGLEGGFKLIASSNPTGITTNGSDFWVISNNAPDYVYHFNAFGQNVTGTPGLEGGFSAQIVTTGAMVGIGITTN